MIELWTKLAAADLVNRVYGVVKTKMASQQ